jgi:hypothetical protein
LLNLEKIESPESYTLLSKTQTLNAHRLLLSLDKSHAVSFLFRDIFFPCLDYLSKDVVACIERISQAMCCKN